jgi:DNA ligase-1
MILQRLREFCDEVNKNNSTNKKKEVLKKYEDLKQIFYYTYHPLYQFNVTSETLKKRKDLMISDFLEEGYVDIFTLLDDLRLRKITGHKAISYVNRFIWDNKQYADLIYNIIDKNLKTRTDIKVINDVFNNLIPEFSVALAESITKYNKVIDFKKETWFASHKLDGIRCVTIINEKGEVNFYSREGNEFFTLNVLKDEIIKLNLKSTVLDGELCIIDENGKEDFISIIKQFRKKDYTILNPGYCLFDMLTLEEFTTKQSIRLLSERRKDLIETIKDNKYLKILPQIKVTSEEHLNELTELAKQNKWEGLILRLDTTYKGKRSFDLLKVKKFCDAEYKILKVETGPFRVITNGIEVEENMLTNIIIEHKGNRVSVGSGFSLEERRLFFNNPELLIGKEITVKYFEETETEKDGVKVKSLRFPTKKHIWLEGKRNV